MFERERCGATGKLIFKTKEAGKLALPDFRRKPGVWHVKWCPFCSMWHLTSSSGPRKGKKDTHKVTRGKR